MSISSYTVSLWSGNSRPPNRTASSPNGPPASSIGILARVPLTCLPAFDVIQRPIHRPKDLSSGVPSPTGAAHISTQTIIQVEVPTGRQTKNLIQPIIRPRSRPVLMLLHVHLKLLLQPLPLPIRKVIPRPIHVRPAPYIDVAHQHPA